MIGYISGIIKFKEIDSLIIDVRGVGYELRVPSFVWEDAKLEQKKSFFIHTHVKEDELSLYAFTSPEDKQVFRYLISVSGIGPRSALNILSYANGGSNVVKAIQKADVDFFCSIKGLGKKSSQRIIVDLRAKIGGLKDLEFEAEADRDLIEALKGLGFSRNEIKKSIKGIKKNLSLEEKIKVALRQQNF